MTCRKHLIQVTWVGALLGAFLFAGSCTDSDLYQWKTTPYQPNKLTVSGTVCTDDLQQADFPKKILFIIDMSQSLRGAKNDPNGLRGKAVEDMINLWGKNPNYEFGVTIFGAKAKNLLTDSTGNQPVGFTRDMSKLLAAAKQIKSGGGYPEISTCRSGRCRDLRAALSLANSIVSGDILAADPGTVARTTYVLVLFSGGPPVPPIGRCACRDKDEEKTDGAACVANSDCKSDQCVGNKCMNKWQGCAWTECDNCNVTCDLKISTCKGGDCLPICTPACDNSDPTDPEFCNANFTCVDGTPVVQPTVPPLSTIPPSTPDTFSFRIVPPKTPGVCNKKLTCVHAAGGHTDSCEEKLLLKDVWELKTFAKKNGAGAFQLHTTYLPDNETRKCTAGTTTTPGYCDPFYPAPAYPVGHAKYLTGCTGNAAAQKARTVRLLSQMAYAGNGGFEQYAAAALIPPGFLNVGRKIFMGQDSLVFKELVVYNENVVADATGIHADTDADGIPDTIEQKLGTCLSDEDTDGDGLSDSVEVKLASDPLKADQTVECIDLKTTQEKGDDPCDASKTPKQKTWIRYVVDKDKDRLNECEERLLGTDDTLYDTDADGIPDRIEFIAGTNYLAIDPLLDSDMDGVVNREEIRGHTDPRSNDAQGQLDRAYRYEEVDEGLREVLGFSQLTNITGVRVKNVSSGTSPGVGWLKLDQTSGKPMLAWRDYSDMDIGGNYGPAIDISKACDGCGGPCSTDAECKTTGHYCGSNGKCSGYRLTSCRLVKGGGCTKDSAAKFITVTVDGKAGYPPASLTEKINISSAKRNCLRFTVRNITLVQTGMHRLLKTEGNNTVIIYFAEAPAKAKDGYGIFRIASVRLNYTEGPPASRSPKDPEITFTDDDFVLDIKK
jgi:hypothetical protein